MQRIAYLAFLFVWLAFGLVPAAQAQSAAQAYAQAKYNEYLAAHETTWRAQAQGHPQHVVDQYLAYERAAWAAYTQAQNAANNEAQVRVNHYAALIDAAVNSWANFIRTIYDRRDVNAYATDPTYRGEFDRWVYNWHAYANHMVQVLLNYRQQLVVTPQAPTQPAPPRFDPRYTGPDLGPGPESQSYDRSRGFGPLPQ
jgi:hypothetical protein